MRDSGIESEAETDAFHALVINAWGEDADEDFIEKYLVGVCVYNVCKYMIAVSTSRQLLFPHVGLL